MKATILLVATLVAALTLNASTALAAGKGNRRKGGDKPDADKVAPATDDPFAGLQPFIQNIDQLLTLHRVGNKSFEAFAAQASGRITVIRAQFAAQRVSAQPADQPRLDAALATCDAISRSLDERQEFIGQLDASRAVKAPSQLNRKRKDDPGLIEYSREQLENREARSDAQKTDRAFTAAARDRWTRRSIELRQQIQTTYGRIATAGSA